MVPLRRPARESNDGWCTQGLQRAPPGPGARDADRAARIAGLGGRELISWIGSLVLPFVATQTVLDRLDVGPGVLGSQFTVSTGPVLVALLALVLAQAFRRGGELARDADGLV